MKRHLVVPMIVAGVALASGVASANPTYWRQHGLLLEVSADPRDGRDFVRTNPTHATRLELVALNDTVRLRGVTVRFADGRTFSQAMHDIRPGERVMVQLPANRGTIQSVDLDYGRQVVDRTPARLQIIPHVDQPTYARPSYPRDRDHRRYSRYDRQPATQPSYYAAQPRSYSTQPSYYSTQPSYYSTQPSYYSTQPSHYTVQPSVTWSGSVQGSFRFQ
jgi:hypothetical protein